jgi:hypothetical protein
MRISSCGERIEMAANFGCAENTSPMVSPHVQGRSSGCLVSLDGPGISGGSSPYRISRHSLACNIGLRRGSRAMRGKHAGVENAWARGGNWVTVAFWFGNVYVLGLFGWIVRQHHQGGHDILKLAPRSDSAVGLCLGLCPGGSWAGSKTCPQPLGCSRWTTEGGAGWAC